jgi:hypothetical protein
LDFVQPSSGNGSAQSLAERTERAPVTIIDWKNRMKLRISFSLTAGPLLAFQVVICSTICVMGQPDAGQGVPVMGQEWRNGVLVPVPLRSGPSPAEIAAQQQQQREEANKLNEKGIQYLNDHEYKLAFDAFKAALEKWPNDPAIRDNLDKASAAISSVEIEKDNADVLRKHEAFTKANEDMLKGMKGIGVGGDLDLKGVAETRTSDLGLKGVEDSSLQLKDAMRDNTSGQKLFNNQNASKDLFSANAHGLTALDRAESLLAGDAANPYLKTSMEQAKAEADKRFGREGSDAGQFETVVLIGNSGSQQPSQYQTVHVPKQVAKDLNYRKLVTERDALDHQIQQKQKEVESLKADPNYSRSSALLTKAYQLDNTIESLKVYKKFDDDRVAKMIHMEPVDFGDTPSPKKGLDQSLVPPPSTAPLSQ